MRKIVFILSLFLVVSVIITNAQCSGNKSVQTFKKSKVGIIISSNDAETVWNALRIANYSKSEGDTVTIFLLGKGVEAPNIDSKNFTVKEELDTYVKSGGKVLACSTCLSMRNVKEPKMCTVSTLSDLYSLIKTNDKVLSF